MYLSLVLCYLMFMKHTIIFVCPDEMGRCGPCKSSYPSRQVIAICLRSESRRLLDASSPP